MTADKPKLLLCGDFAVHTGLSQVNESLALHLRDKWDIAVLAINFHGDHTPLNQRYRLYPAIGGGDNHGIGRIAQITQHERPDALLMVHDPWVVSAWLHALQAGLPTDYPMPPTVGYIPVDGIGLNPQHVLPLNSLSAAISYTQFGRAELRRAGLTIACHVLPHGIDRERFYPIDQAEARTQLGMDADTYAVLVFDANQARKRLDLAFDAFARFAIGKPDSVKLLYHGPLITPNGWDIEAMAADLGIHDRLLLSSRFITQTRGVKPDFLRVIYSACDLKLSVAPEGWGLTTMEAMACGLPCIVPDFAALGEWARPAALPMPATISLRHCGAFEEHGINHAGHVPDVSAAVKALDHLYDHPEVAPMLREKGLTLVNDPRYDWANITTAFDAVLREAATQSTKTQVVALNVRPNTIDSWVVEQVITKNEYGIGDLAADDLVIDIGAHIGAFSRLAFDHGSRRIEAYEADAENAAIARANLEALGVAVTHAAVWRSDVRYPCALSFTGHDGKNTGAGNVVFGDGQQIEVWATPLDDIIGDRSIALLKIDAESAEWPILLTSQKLHHIACIVGEYHEIGGVFDQNAMPASLADLGYDRFTGIELRAYLESQGFEVTIRAYVLSDTGAPSNMGSFHAVRGTIPYGLKRRAEQAVCV